MFERFTAAARDVVRDAYVQADDLRSPYVGTEHLLLALLEPTTGIAQRVLSDAGVNAASVRAAVERLTGAPPAVLTREDAAALETLGIDADAVLARIEQSLGPGALVPPECPPRRRFVGHRFLRPRRRGAPRTLRFGPKAKKVLELSLREAVALRHDRIGAEHVLLGLLRERTGLAARVLTDAGIDLDVLRQSVLRTLSQAA